MTARLGGLVLLIVSVAGAIPAREPDGRLGLVVAPNDTQPVMVQPGQEFDVLLRTEAALRLESAEGSYELAAGAGAGWRGRIRVAVTTPENAAPGTYTLVAETPEASDHAFRAVHVYNGFPETYAVAQLNDLRVGAAVGRDTVLYRSARAINSREASLVLVTGNLTANGRADEFRIALEVLNAIAAPTLVVPGAVDRASGGAEEFLGPYPVTRRYGRDGFLMYYTEPGPTDWNESIHGQLYPARRSIRASRWSVGVSNRYVLGSSLRDALTLFVDDPLDVLVAGGASGPVDGEVHWGGTLLFGPSEARRGSVRWYTAGPRGLRPAGDGD